MIAPMLPAVFALAGTLLFAIAIFAPRHKTAGGPAISFAPPADPPPVFEQWTAARAEEARPASAAWPLLIDPAAADVSAAARHTLIGALGDIGAPWAEAVLAVAAEEDPDPDVRAAALSARNAR